VNKYFNSKKLFCVYDPLSLSHIDSICLCSTLCIMFCLTHSRSLSSLLQQVDEDDDRRNDIDLEDGKENYARHRPNREMHFVPVIRELSIALDWLLCVMLEVERDSRQKRVLYNVIDDRKCRLHVL
jgi:hypothetical protein